MKGEKRPPRADSDPTLFDFNTTPNTTNAQSGFSGRPGQINANPFIDPFSIGPRDPPANPFVRNETSNSSPWPRTNLPVNPSPFKFGEKKTEPMASQEEFIMWAERFLDLDQPDMDTITFRLRSLWDSITSFSSSFLLTEQWVTESRNSIRNMKSEIAKTQAVQSTDVLADARRDLLSKYQDRISFARQSLLEQQQAAHKLRADLAKAVCLPLQKLTSMGKEKQNGYEKKIKESKWEAESNLVEVVEALEKTRKELAAAQDQIALVESEKAEVESELVAGYFEIRDLSVTIDGLYNDLENKDAQRIKETKALTDQYHARAEMDAEAKSVQNAKTTAKVEELERQIEALEKQKMDITCAKTTVEKEREDFEAKVNELKGYKDGYSQLVLELDELQGTYNDVIAERDDLIKQMQDTAASAKDPSRHELAAAAQPSPAAHHQSGTARATNSDHLDGLIYHWQKQIKIKMTAIEKAQADIASLEAEIREAHNLLFPAWKRTTRLVETAIDNSSCTTKRRN